MTFVLEAEGLGKRYGRHEALADCNLQIPEGRVVGLVGPNRPASPRSSGWPAD